MPPSPRTLQLKVMISPKEHRILHRLAKRHGVSASDIVRQLIRGAQSTSAEILRFQKDK